jgi:hypothetical protein
MTDLRSQLGATVGGRYLITAFLGKRGEMAFLSAQSLPPAMADHRTLSVVLRVLLARNARAQAAFAKQMLGDSRVLDVGRLDDGRLYCAIDVLGQIAEEPQLIELAA